LFISSGGKQLGPEKKGPIVAILELLRSELDAVIHALPDQLKEDLPDHLKEDSAAPA
jgi:hypothetical protein